MKIKIWLVILILSSYQFLIKSQVKSLTLEESIRNAIETNEDIIKTQYSIQAQESIIRTRYGNLLPNLSLNLGWNRSNQYYKTDILYNGLNFSSTRDTTTDNFSFGLRSDVTLFNGFNNYQEVDVAKMNRRTYLLQEEKLKNQIALNVINYYVTVLKNQQIVSINKARLEDARNQLDRIKQFVEVGKRTVSDIYKQDVQVAQYELAVEQSINNVNKSISDLVDAARLSQNVEYALRTEDIKTIANYNEMNNYVQANSNLNTLVTRAYDNRYEVKQILQTIDINEANLSIQSNNLVFPTVSAFSSYNLNGGTFGKITNSRVFTIGINISYPIFQGFQLSNLRQQAELNLRSSEQDLQKTKKQIELDIKKSLLDLKSLLKQIEITERTLKAAEQDKTLAEVSYEAGLATLLDVQTATVQYNNALIERSNLNYNFIMAQKQLEFLQGLLKY